MLGSHRKMPSRKEWTDKLRLLIDENLEKQSSINMRVLVAQFGVDNYKSPRTVKEFIYALKDAGRIYIEKNRNGSTIYRSREKAEKSSPSTQVLVKDEKQTRFESFIK